MVSAMPSLANAATDSSRVESKTSNAFIEHFLQYTHGRRSSNGSTGLAFFDYKKSNSSLGFYLKKGVLLAICSIALAPLGGLLPRHRLG